MVKKLIEIHHSDIYFSPLYLYLAVGVDLSPDSGVLVQGVLAADGEGGAATHGAGPGDAGLQGGAVLQVNSASVNLGRKFSKSAHNKEVACL